MHLLAKMPFFKLLVAIALFFGVFFTFGGTSSAVTLSAGFENASTWTINNLEFEVGDIGNTIDQDDIDILKGSGTDQDGIDELNRLIDLQIEGRFIDANAVDSDREFLRATVNGCGGDRSKFVWSNQDNRYEIQELRMVIGQGGCRDIIDGEDLVFTPTPTDDFLDKALFFFSGEAVIERTDGVGGQFILDASTGLGNRYFSVNEQGDNNQDFVDVTGGSSRSGFSEVFYEHQTNNKRTEAWKVFELDASGNPTASSQTVDQDSGNTNAIAEEEDACNDLGGTYSFLLCPILVIATEAIEVMDENIVNALEVKEKYYSGPEIRTAWSRIRDISYIILIPVLLVMVISTALGYSFVDAYTVKRAMPRLLVAVIFMALSFDICVLLIELTNNVGNGVANIVASPFGGKGALELEDIFSVGEGIAISSVTTVGLGAIALALVSGAVSLMVMVSYFGSAAIFLIVVFGLLTIREMLIIFLMIFAPLAIVSWIFPGNDKVWKLWWGTFSKLLLVFPVIMALVWLGRGFAKIIFVSDATGIEAVFLLFAKMIAFLLGWLLIKSVLEWVQGGFAQVTGKMDGFGKRLSEGNKKYRGEKLKKDWERLRQGKAVTRGFKGGMKDGKTRADRINEGLQKAAFLNKAFDGKNDFSSAKGLKGSIATNIQTAIERELGPEQKHFEEDKDAAFSLHDDQSGAASDISLQAWHRLEDKLLDYGFAVDENGDTDNVKLKGVIDDIKAKAEKGDFDGAYRAYLNAANDRDNSVSTIFNGGDEDPEINKAVANMANLRRKYSKEVLDLSLVQRAAAGGTYYQGGESAFEALTDATAHDMNAYAAGSVKIRQALLQTGRTDQGAISHGQSFLVRKMRTEMERSLKSGDTSVLRKYMEEQEWDQDDIDSAMTAPLEEQLKTSRQVVSDHIQNVVWEQQGAQTLTHTQVKTERVLKNMMPVLERNLEKAERKAGGRLETSDQYTEEENKAIEEYARQLAGSANIWQSLQASKPEIARKVAPQLIGKKLASGKTVQETIDIAAATSDAYRRYHKEFLAKTATVQDLEQQLQDLRARGGSQEQIAALQAQINAAGGIAELGANAAAAQQNIIPPIR